VQELTVPEVLNGSIVAICRPSCSRFLSNGHMEERKEMPRRGNKAARLLELEPMAFLSSLGSCWIGCDVYALTGRDGRLFGED
jgi:hypothetical protein